MVRGRFDIIDLGSGGAAFLPFFRMRRQARRLRYKRGGEEEDLMGGGEEGFSGRSLGVAPALESARDGASTRGVNSCRRAREREAQRERDTAIGPAFAFVASCREKRTDESSATGSVCKQTHEAWSRDSSTAWGTSIGMKREAG